MPDFKFVNAPDGANPEPNAYHVVYTDAQGRGGSEKIIPSIDPANNPTLSEEQVLDEVKAMLMQQRADWYLRGVKAENVTVTKIGPLTPSDRERLGSVFVNEAQPAKVTRVTPK
jgi:hypothetical protein